MNSVTFMHGKLRHTQADPYSTRTALLLMHCVCVCIGSVLCVSPVKGINPGQYI